VVHRNKIIWESFTKAACHRRYVVCCPTRQLQRQTIKKRVANTKAFFRRFLVRPATIHFFLSILAKTKLQVMRYFAIRWGLGSDELLIHHGNCCVRRRLTPVTVYPIHEDLPFGWSVKTSRWVAFEVVVLQTAFRQVKRWKEPGSSVKLTSSNPRFYAICNKHAIPFLQRRDMQYLFCCYCFYMWSVFCFLWAQKWTHLWRKNTLQEGMPKIFSHCLNKF